MTVPMPKPVAPSAGEQAVAALMSMQASEGWAIVVKILDDNIKYLEACILDRVDPITKEALGDKEIADARVKRGLNIELRDTPKNYIATIEEEGEVPENFDPYFKTKEEIDAARPKERVQA